MLSQISNKTLKIREIDRIIWQALREDAYKEDVTTNFLIPKNKVSKAHIIVKEEAVICGLDIAKRVFQKLDEKIEFHSCCKDGDKVKKNTKIALLKGKSRALLTAERVALNLLGHLSGIATYTHKYVEEVSSFKTTILGTRKTTPCLRSLEKYAVRCGGGSNHRSNLKEMIFVKDNHRVTFRDNRCLDVIVKRFQKRVKKTLLIEVDTLSQLKQVLKTRPDIILLDNMNIPQMKKAVWMIKRTYPHDRPLIEASGGVTLKSVHSIAETGVDRISIGSLTHSKQAINFTMEIVKQ